MSENPSDGPRRRPSPYPRPAEPEASTATAQRRGRAPLLFAVLALALVVAAGVTYVVSPSWLGRGTDPHDVGRVPTMHGKLVDYISPHRIVIPKLHEQAPIVHVGTSNRELDIPLDPKIVGWWDGGAKPGARRGTALLAGHINYAGVTGALASIGQLKPGDTVYVTGLHKHRRVRLTFRITGVRSYAKTSLPYKKIFDQRSVGRLAIVTCGGPFDASTGNYLENIVAFAVPA